MTIITNQLQENHEFYELHMIMLKWFKDKNKTPNDVISFMTASWVGQMCLNGYKEYFVDKTLEHMKEKWKTHRLNKYYFNKGK